MRNALLVRTAAWHSDDDAANVANCVGACLEHGDIIVRRQVEWNKFMAKSQRLSA